MTEQQAVSNTAGRPTPVIEAPIETTFHTVDGKPQYDATTLHVVEAPPDLSAAAIRQLLRQVTHGRVAVVISQRHELKNFWSNDGVSREAGLVFLQSLRRQADAQNIEVALITRDLRLRGQAADVGLPVFSSVEGARSQPWHNQPSALEGLPPSPMRDANKPISVQRRSEASARRRGRQLVAGSRPSRSPWLETTLLAATLALAVGLIMGALVFLVPDATVTLVPAQEPLAETVTVIARSDVVAPNTEQGVVPTRRIGQRVEVEGSMATTGRDFAPSEPAKGTVIFTNRRSESQEIPAGTVVTTSTGSNVRFQTTEPATLSGGLGSRATVPIQAMDPGPGGNVRAFTINTTEGPLGVTTNVTNPSDTTGGDVKEVGIVSQADKDTLRARLEQEARQKAYLALGELLEEGEFVPSETVGTLVIEETYNHFTDEVSDELKLRLRLLATAWAVDGQSADEMALRALSAKIPRRGQMLTDSVKWEHGPAVVTEEGDALVITFTNMASSVAVLDIDPALVRESIRGKTPADAIAILQSNWRLQSPPELVLGPAWLHDMLNRYDWLPVPTGRVPWLPFRTRVNVQFVVP